MKRFSIIGRILFIGVLIAMVGTACQLNFNVYELNLPFVPTVTGTPLPTATNTPTATVPPKPDSLGEVFRIDVQPDDSTIFVDKELGYQVVFSPEWLVVPVDADLQAEIVAEAEEEFQGKLSELIGTLELAGMRALAFDYTGKYEINPNYLGNLNILYDETSPEDVSLEEILDESVATFPEFFEDSRVTYHSIEENSRGVTYASMIATHPADTFGVPVTQVFMMVQLDTGLLVLTGSVHEESYLDAERTLKNIFNSFEFVE